MRRPGARVGTVGPLDRTHAPLAESVKGVVGLR